MVVKTIKSNQKHLHHTPVNVPTEEKRGAGRERREQGREKEKNRVAWFIDMPDV